MRLRNIPRAAKELAEHPETVIRNPLDFCGNWAKNAFGNQNPVHIEIGIGRGNFIKNTAMQNPAINYVGIEKFDSVLLRALEKTAGQNIKNLRLLRFDATDIVEIFGEGEVEKIYINFCDPWEKNAYKSRRLTHKIFLEKYAKILAQNGSLQFKTDNRGLFEFSLREFNNFGLRFNEIILDLHAQKVAWNICTEYEEKFTALGKNTYFAHVSFITLGANSILEAKGGENMRKSIELGRGIGENLLFGMRAQDVRKVLGEPSEIDNSQVPSRDGEETGDTVAFIYDDFGLTLYFDEEDEWRLGTIEADDDEFLLGGKKIIGLPFDEVKNTLENLNFADITEENLGADEEDGVEIRLLFSDAKSVNIWFEDGVCSEVQFSPFWENGQIIWPTQYS